ncbi:PEP-CTERM sorting domain-containing protein [Trichloromonas sp.]|uniref:PEP-CTERM sorting domain-containing protein n=1 Tax=Trichloromonas sp. TaxID=3069249 RepID=UPI003D816A71
MKYPSLLLVALVSLLLSIPSGASATRYTMTFGINAEVKTTPSVYVEGGYRARAVNSGDGYNHFDFLANADVNLGIHTTYNAEEVIFDHFGVGFDLVSLDIESFWGAAAITSSTGIMRTLSRVETILFDSAWQNITSFTIKTTSPHSGLSIDNIVFENPPTIPTPEPSTLLLLGAGLIGLAGYGRRRMSKQV